MWYEYMLFFLVSFAVTMLIIAAFVKHQSDMAHIEYLNNKILYNRLWEKRMDLETKAAYFEYIKDLERNNVATPMNCHNELKKRFPNLDEQHVERLVNLYIKEEIEGKTTFLTE